MNGTVLTTGHGLVESPRWHDGRLWFSDWTAGRILAVDETGTTEVMVRHGGLPLCFDFLPDGRPIVVSNLEHALLTVEADGALAHYADLTPVSPLGCNDITVDRSGRVYVNSPNFDFAAGPPPGERSPGVVGLVTPDGRARVVAEDLAFPNGMAVTADGSTLIVAESYRNRLTAFEIDSDGSLSGRRAWADLGADHPDGIQLDRENAVWYADVGARHCVRVVEGGQVLDTVELDRGAFACALDPAGRLFVVAAHWPGPQRLADFADWDGQLVRFDRIAGRE